ncbi:MAG TPA: Uma2 family endonuclease [Nitrospira sp.]|nr:Uma2 family endonuclease [Nitrospira sp.]
MATTAARKRSPSKARVGSPARDAMSPLAFAIPAQARDLEGFRDWSRSRQFPENGSIAFIAGKIWVDMSPERIESHNDVKTELNRVLANLAVSEDLGKFQADRVRLINVDADLSCDPDGLFALWASYEKGKLTKQPAKDGRASVELIGSPDWVAEIVSPSSEEKDTKELLSKYHLAGISGYWLIDARDKFRFTMFQWKPDGYKAVAAKNGWNASEVFGHSFRWRQFKNRLGEVQYRLEIR